MANPERNTHSAPFTVIFDAWNKPIGLHINPSEWKPEGIRAILHTRIIIAEKTRFEIQTDTNRSISWDPDFLVEGRRKGIEKFLDDYTLLVKRAKSVDIYDIKPVNTEAFINGISSIDDV